VGSTLTPRTGVPGISTGVPGISTATRPLQVRPAPQPDVLELIHRPDPPAPPEPPPPASFRADVQGLRAIAVLMVLLYHVGLGPSGGFLGVDAFFVLSGFLITGLLVREHERTGRISLTAFWAKRARRLLPASVLVLLVTCIVARWYLPPARWASVGNDAAAASGYVLNWRLAAESVDYLSEGAAPSPLQHFWSLAIEEQFYLFWPLLISLLLVARKRNVLLGVISAVIGVSLALALITYSPQTYFTTHTRIWELAAGALCAVTMPRPHRHRARHARTTSPSARWGPTLLGWTGLAVLLGALFVVRPESMWPGPLTVLVIAGTTLILRYGQAERGVHVLLSTRGLTRIGDISYSLYLWHWPLVVFAEVDGRLTAIESWTIVGLSLILATATYRLVEGPARAARLWAPTRLGLAGGLALALVAASAGTVLALQSSVPEALNALGAAGKIAVQSSATALIPRPEEAYRDNGEIYTRGCPSDYDDSSVRPCVFDFRSSGDDPTVAAVGDSKMGQWIPALEEIAKQRHWRLISMTKAGCAFSAAERLEGNPAGVYESCVTWNANILQQIRTIAPALLFTTQLESYPTVRDGTALTGRANRAEMIRGLAVRLAQMKDAGVPVATFAETPRMATNVPDCVSVHLSDLASCTRLRPRGLANAGVVKSAAQQYGDPVLDLNDRICTPLVCPSVIGDVLVYRDDHHLTATYARTLTPFIENRLRQILKTTLSRELLGTAN
jgi:peptidoglycan/LPS O-acetylase OafA/YrhL